MKFELSIVMPCLNEAETLATCVTKAKTFLQDSGVNGEIVIADNGSTDGSIDIAESLGCRVVRIEEKGYGNCLKGGFNAAEGKYIIMGDSDDSYDFLNLMPFLEKLRQGYDLVMGNRFKGGIKKGAMPFLNRYLGNPVLSFIGRLFFRIKIGDFHCGLRGFSKEAVLRMNLKTTGMELASEIVVNAALLKLKIAEVPTILSPDGRTRKPHLRTWHDGWRHLRFLLVYSPQWLFLYPGIFLMVLGFIISTYLMFNQIVLNQTHFDVNTLLYSTTFLFMGFQFISFFVFAKVFAVTNELLPYSKNFDKAFTYFNLERGLLIGAAIFLTGIGLSVYAIVNWSKAGFGTLNPSESLRLVIPAAFAVIIGLQIILNSFLLSIMGLKRK